MTIVKNSLIDNSLHPVTHPLDPVADPDRGCGGRAPLPQGKILYFCSIFQQFVSEKASICYLANLIYLEIFIWWGTSVIFHGKT